MIRRILILSFLAPAFAYAQSGAGGASDVGSWSVQQLCESRDDPAVWRELEHRQLFSKRELRLIKSEHARAGISPDAVSCFLGEPASIVDANGDQDRDPLYAYVYPVDENNVWVLHVRERPNEAVVVRVIKLSTDPGVCYSENPGDTSSCWRRREQGSRITNRNADVY